MTNKVKVVTNIILGVHYVHHQKVAVYHLIADI